MVVGDLFHEQSGPWESIVNNHVKVAWNAAKKFLELVICAISDKNVSTALMNEVFEPALRKLVSEANAQMSNCLMPTRASTQSPMLKSIARRSSTSGTRDGVKRVKK